MPNFIEESYVTRRKLSQKTPVRRDLSCKALLSDGQRLWQAYERTTFVARVANKVLQIRPGKRSPGVDRLLKQYRAKRFAFIGAYNPGSKTQSTERNQSAHRRLVAAIERRRFSFWEGEGVGERGNWPAEPGLLVLGIRSDEARLFGRRFGQVAIVVGNIGSAARLMPCDRRWGPGRDPVPPDHWGKGGHVRFAYCTTPEVLGGNGVELSLLVESADGVRIRKKDSRADAYETLFNSVPLSVLMKARASELVDWSPETPVNIPAVTFPSIDAFNAFATLFEQAGYAGLRFVDRPGRLDCVDR